jgi:hypothetical protein
MTAHTMLMEVEAVIAYVLQALHAASCFNLILITFLTSSTLNLHKEAEPNFCLFFVHQTLRILWDIRKTSFQC